MPDRIGDRMLFALSLLAAAGDPEAPLPEAEGFPEFFEEFQAAVVAGDCSRIAEMTSYPFRSYDLYDRLPRRLRKTIQEGDTIALEREDFLDVCPRMFDRETREHFPGGQPTPRNLEEPEYLYYSYGIWSGPTWTVWVNFAREDDGRWTLRNTDNVSYAE